MNTIQSHRSSSPLTHFLLEQIRAERHSPQPKMAGEDAPYFRLPLSSGSWPQLPQPLGQSREVTLADLLGYKPLVISFYSPRWHRYGHNHIENLVKAYPKIRALGGELLVLTPESPEGIAAIAGYYQVPFNVGQDSNNLIASQFGVYSPYHPVWERIAGISDEVALPATYVVAPDGQIVYDFVEADFSDFVPVRELLSAVYSLKHTTLQKVA